MGLGIAGVVLPTVNAVRRARGERQYYVGTAGRENPDAASAAKLSRHELVV